MDHISLPQIIEGKASQLFAGPDRICGTFGKFDTVAGKEKLTGKELKCWGKRFPGDEEGSDNNTKPKVVAGLSLPPDEKVSVAVGPFHACLTLKGVVYCWGGNTNTQNNEVITAQAGQPHEFFYKSPTKYDRLESATQVAVGAEHSCSVVGYYERHQNEKGNAVACWGAETRGQFGASMGESGFRTGTVTPQWPTPWQ
jgi:hypothetical protein